MGKDTQSKKKLFLSFLIFIKNWLIHLWIENNAPLKYRVTRERSEYEKLSKLLVAIFWVLKIYV